MGYSVEAGGAKKLAVVTPSDSTELRGVAALYIGNGGNVSIIAENDTAEVILANVASGTILPISAYKVRATSTTATSIVAMRY